MNNFATTTLSPERRTSSLTITLSSSLLVLVRVSMLAIASPTAHSEFPQYQMDIVHHPSRFPVIRLPVLQRPPHIAESDAARGRAVTLHEVVGLDFNASTGQSPAVMLS